MTLSIAGERLEIAAGKVDRQCLHHVLVAADDGSYALRTSSAYIWISLKLLRAALRRLSRLP
jgi:hypothetical protein